MALINVLTAGVGTPSQLVGKEEAQTLLVQAIQCLPVDYGTVVRLYDLEGQPVEDVAEVMGRSAGAVYMLRMRAHDRLRELLGGGANIFDSHA